MFVYNLIVFVIVGSTFSSQGFFNFEPLSLTVV